MYRLSTLFSKFYSKCIQFGEVIPERIMLCKLIKQIMEVCFKILNIDTIEKI